MSSSPVAVLDIGSNSIKILVALPGISGGIYSLFTRTIDARISAGISCAAPHLSAEGMARGLAAIQALLEDAAAHHATTVALVATSAVRDAQNGQEFQARVLAATGHRLRILTGDEEANLIGRGLTSDPAAQDLHDFYAFDLGGGSLECLAFRDRQIEQAVSLPLGCVRLTEKFSSDPAGPLSDHDCQKVAAHTRTVLADSSFRFSLPPSAIAIGTGGTVTTARGIIAALLGQKLIEAPPMVRLSDLHELLARMAPLPLAARQQIPGLPAARADVFPVALVTLTTLAAAGRISGFRNSFYNLRYGLAAEALAGPARSGPLGRAAT